MNKKYSSTDYIKAIRIADRIRKRDKKGTIQYNVMTSAINKTYKIYINNGGTRTLHSIIK